MASELVSVADDPLLERRGPGSRPFDGEGGLLARKNVVVENGNLAHVPLRLLRRAEARAREHGERGARRRGRRRAESTSNFILSPGRPTRTTRS